MKVRDLRDLIDDLNPDDDIFFVTRTMTIYEVFEKVLHNGRMLMVMKNILPEKLPQPEQMIEDNDYGVAKIDKVVPQELQPEKRAGRPKKKEGDPTAPYVRKVPLEKGTFASGKRVGRPKKKTKERVSMQRKNIIKKGEII